MTSGILIIITVFLPLLTLQGLEGKFFVPVALTIVFALAASLILSLTVIPVLASLLLKEVKHEDPWLPRHLLRLYIPSLEWAFRHPRLIGTAAAALLVGASLIYFNIGKTFIPVMDEGDIVVGIEKLPSVSLEETAALDLKIQQEIMNHRLPIERKAEA